MMRTNTRHERYSIHAGCWFVVEGLSTTTCRSIMLAPTECVLAIHSVYVLLGREDYVLHLYIQTGCPPVPRGSGEHSKRDTDTV